MSSYGSRISRSCSGGGDFFRYFFDNLIWRSLMREIFYPSQSSIICMVIFLLIPSFISAFFGVLMWTSVPIAWSGGTVFFAISTLAFLFFLYHMSQRVELTSSEIIRRSAFGAKSLKLADVTSALFSSVKCVEFLTINTSEKWGWIRLSTHAFSKDQLQQIQDVLKSEALRSSRPFQSVVLGTPPTIKGMTRFVMVEMLLFVAIFVGIVIIGINQTHPYQSPKRVYVQPN